MVVEIDNGAKVADLEDLFERGKDLIRMGYAVVMRGRSGKLIYTEGWRRVRFYWEAEPGAAAVFAESARHWELPLIGLPVWPLTSAAKSRVLDRIRNYLSKYGLKLEIDQREGKY